MGVVEARAEGQRRGRARVSAAAAAVLALLTAPGAGAQTPTCEVLEEEARERAQRLLEEQYLYDCCDRTIAACLQDTPTCRLAVRLAAAVCWRVAAGQEDAVIARALARRAQSMMPGPTVDIDLGPEAVGTAGPDTARVTLVEYACARCPYCAKVTPELYREVTAGRLQGRVRLCFKPWPIRSHAHSRETNLGLVAALRLGHFWPFLLDGYEHFGRFQPGAQAERAAAVGMDAAAFEGLMTDAATEAQLVANKKEGLRHGVDATPTFFVNGRRYVADLSLEGLVDALLEEWERETGRIYVEDP